MGLVWALDPAGNLIYRTYTVSRVRELLGSYVQRQLCQFLLHAPQKIRAKTSGFRIRGLGQTVPDKASQAGHL